MTGQNRAFHPLLVAVFPTLFLYSRNLHAVALSDVLRPVALTLAATLVVWGALRACRIDGPRGALIVSAGLILFFSFGSGVRLIARLGIAREPIIQERLALAVEAILLAAFVGFVLRKPDLVRSLIGGCNASSLALVALSAAGIVGQTWGDQGNPPPEVEPPVVQVVSPPGRLPDIYFLVLDAYGRSDVLRDFIGFDNSAFLDRLERRGFVVARRSRSNYCQTALSLSATLNLRYLDDLAGSRSPSRLPLKRLIAENAVFRAFRGQGYRLVTFASGFDATEDLGADLTLAPPSDLRTFHALVADQTPLWLLLGRQAEFEPHRMHRDRIIKALDDLPAASHPSSSPTFTFAHILAPHPPFVFGADGEDVSAGEAAYTLNDSEGWCRIEGHGGPEDYARRYQAQVAYLTARVEEAVDRILASSPSPPIILIQGDHGPGSHFDSGSERPNDLQERFGIFNACYLPDDARGLIHDSITPVNTMRVVLDHCLGSKLGLLEDRSYYSAYQTPYAFIDVTDEVDRPGD
jgi:hypothetical protein